MKFWLLSTVAGIAFCGVASMAFAQQDPDNQQDVDGEQPEDERGVRRLGDVLGERGSEFSMDIPQIEMPVEPAAEQPDVTLPDPELDERLQNLLARRAFGPDDPDVESALESLLDDVEVQARQALEDGDLALATRYVNVVEEFDDQRPVVAELAAERQRIQAVQRLLGRAQQALEADVLLEPEEASARRLYQQVLELDEANPEALAGLESVRQQLLARFDDYLEQGNFESAEELLIEAENTGMDPDAVVERRDAIAEARQNREQRLLEQTRRAIENGDADQAEMLFNELVGMGLDEAQVGPLRASLEDAIRYGGFEPGQRFQDDLEGMTGFGPTMVVIPAGSFTMGSPPAEDGRDSNEGPRFRVRFERGFALSRTEVTVGQFRRFVEATGYVTDAERSDASRIYLPRSGRISDRRGVTWEDDFLGAPADDSLPVVHVSWNDASAYARWLAEQTAHQYRLPTEAEFAYALRAGTQTPYWWGEGSPDDEVENVTGDRDEFTDQRRWTNAFRRYGDGYWGPAPAGTFVANPFGLYDMGGNVMEWVRDCWHDGYVRAPDDGSAWVNPGCNRRVIRGGSWNSSPQMSRSAFRVSSREGTTDARVGFRVARDL